MAKDHSNKNFARNSYEKISKFTFGFSRKPPNLTTQPPSVPSPPPPPVTKNHPVHGELTAATKHESQIPREPKPSKRFVRFSSSTIKKSGADDGGKELSGNKTFSEERYNSFIENTKKKMRAPSNVSGERTVSRRESFNDMFSGYISRTKLKLRTTTSVGTSK